MRSETSQLLGELNNWTRAACTSSLMTRGT